MAVDPELKALLNARVEGQIKLAQGQDLMHERMDRFDDRMKEYTEAVLRGLTGGTRRDGGSRSSH